MPSRHPAGSGRGLAQVHDPVTVRAPAKINLFLGVGGLRPDGYHAVTNVAQAVSLYDEVTARAARGVSVSVRGEDADAVPTGRANLAVRAAEALRSYAGVRSGVHLEIRKTIPVAAGLAGGSADAAAALVACDRLWRTGLDRDALTGLAAECGSDVPFALSGGVGLGTGRGEQVSPVLVAGEYHWVLAFASGGLSTPTVYSEFDRLRAAGELPGTGDRPTAAQPGSGEPGSAEPGTGQPPGQPGTGTLAPEVPLQTPERQAALQPRAPREQRTTGDETSPSADQPAAYTAAPDSPAAGSAPPDSPAADPTGADPLAADPLAADPPAADAVLSALRHADAGLLAAVLRNDLMLAAVRLRPDLARTLDAGRELGALAAIVSGSGPTCAFLTASRNERIRLAAGIAGAGVCRAVRQVAGPVHGARVVTDPQRSPTARDTSSS